MGHSNHPLMSPVGVWVGRLVDRQAVDLHVQCVSGHMYNGKQLRVQYM